MGESDFHQRVRFPMDGPFGRRTRLNSRFAKTLMDLSGPSMLPFPSVLCSQTPPQFPVPFAHCGHLLLPSRYSTLSACGSSYNEAQSLHLRYGPLVALPTLNSSRYLHESKARFSVGRLIPLAEAGIAPAESIRLRPDAPKYSSSRSAKIDSSRVLNRQAPGPSHVTPGPAAGAVPRCAGDPPNEEIGDPAAYPEWLADSSPTWAFHQIEELLDEGP
jgi:hypothetical protein